MMDLRRLGIEPVKTDCPAGWDVTDDSSFDTLQREIEKSVSVLEKNRVNWENVVALSSQVLASKSKDFRVAGFLAIGLIHCQNAHGFIVGSAVMLDLIEHYWNDGFPAKARVRGRSRLIAWWIEKASQALSGPEGGVLPSDQADHLCERFEKAFQFLRTQLDDCPSFAPIVTATRLAAGRSKAVESDVPQEASLTSSSKPRTNPSLSKNVRVSEQQVKRELMALSQQIRETASLLMAQKSSNPLIYSLDRMALWLGVDELPPVSEGCTLLPAPDAKRVDRLVQLQRQKQWAALLETAEEDLFQFIFWFDLQRYAAEALSAMGPHFQKAAETVRMETVHFIKRLPGIETLSFSGGMPFANDETRQWLRATPALQSI